MNSLHNSWLDKCFEFDLKIQKLWEKTELSESQKMEIQQKMLEEFNSAMENLKIK